MVVIVLWGVAWLSAAGGALGAAVYFDAGVPSYGLALAVSGAASFALFAALTRIVRASDAYLEDRGRARVEALKEEFAARGTTSKSVTCSACGETVTPLAGHCPECNEPI